MVEQDERVERRRRGGLSQRLGLDPYLEKLHTRPRWQQRAIVASFWSVIFLIIVTAVSTEGKVPKIGIENMSSTYHG